MKDHTHDLQKARYSVTIEVAQSPSVAFSYIIDLPRWWPEEYVGNQLRASTEFLLRSGEGHYSKNKVTEFVPGQKLAWITTESLRKPDNFDWSGTKMIFELSPKSAGTMITFTYDGVVFENEREKLAEICDFCIKNKLYNLIESFQTQIEFTKSATEVFNAIKDIPSWWTQDFQGKCSQQNDEFTIHHPNAHFSSQKLIEVVPDRKIVCQVTDSTLYWLKHDQHEWTDTRIVFELRTHGDKTVLHFIHEGLGPAKECYARCAEGWTMVITTNLYNFVETGSRIN